MVFGLEKAMLEGILCTIGELCKRSVCTILPMYLHTKDFLSQTLWVSRAELGKNIFRVYLMRELKKYAKKILIGYRIN